MKGNALNGFAFVMIGLVILSLPTVYTQGLGDFGLVSTDGIDSAASLPPWRNQTLSENNIEFVDGDERVDGFEDGNYNVSPEWEEAAGMNGAFQVTNQTSFEGDYSLNVTAPNNSNSALVYNRTVPKDFSETFTAKIKLSSDSPTTGYIVGNTDVYSTGQPSLVGGGFNIGYNLFGNERVVALVEDENSDLVETPVLLESSEIPYGEWIQIEVTVDKETGGFEAKIFDDKDKLIGIGDTTIPVENMFLQLNETMIATPSATGSVSVQYDEVNYDVAQSNRIELENGEDSGSLKTVELSNEPDEFQLIEIEYDADIYHSSSNITLNASVYDSGGSNRESQLFSLQNGSNTIRLDDRLKGERLDLGFSLIRQNQNDKSPRVNTIDVKVRSMDNSELSQFWQNLLMSIIIGFSVVAIISLFE